MTPVFCCGFECGTLSHFNGGSLNASISTSIFKNGLRSLRLNPSAAGGHVLTSAIPSSNFYVVRFYIRFESLPTSDATLAHVVSNPVAGLFYKQSDSKIYPATSSGFGSEGISVTTGIWYLIDMKMDLSANPWLIDLKVNGVGVAQHTHAAAQAGNPSQFRLGSNVSETFDIYYDDFVLTNTLADYPIGAGNVKTLIPTSDGTHNVAGTADFRKTLTATDILNSTTDAYQLVDDIPLESGASVDWINMILPPNATDYVECIFGPSSGNPSAIPPRAVEVIAGIHQSGTGNGNMTIRLNDNGTIGDVYSATGEAGVTSVVYKRKHYATAPSGAAWNVNGDGSNGDLRDLRVRFGSPAAVDANPDQYFDCIMIEAEFPDPIPNKIVNINQSVKRAAYW